MIMTVGSHVARVAKNMNAAAACAVKNGHG